MPLDDVLTYQVNRCFTGQHRMWKFEPTPVQEQDTASFTKRLNEQMRPGYSSRRSRGTAALCASNHMTVSLVWPSYDFGVGQRVVYGPGTIFFARPVGGRSLSGSP